MPMMDDLTETQWVVACKLAFENNLNHNDMRIKKLSLLVLLSFAANA
jgi:hypothetical protein